MSNFQLYTGDSRVYPTYGSLLVTNGAVVDFAALPVPPDGRWSSTSGPATVTINPTVTVTVVPQLAVTSQVYNPGTGAPTTGSYPAGELAVDSSGAEFLCTAAGTPGTWVPAQAGAFAPLAAALGMQFVDAHAGDPTGVADSTAAYNAAVAALGSSPGVVVFGVGAYKMVGPTTPITHQAQYVVGQGKEVTVVNDHQASAGDLFRISNPGASGFGGGIIGLSINGASAPAGSAGLHIGDGWRLEVDIAVYGYTGAGSMGVHFDNTVWWTEGAQVRLHVANCTQIVVFDVSGANTSTRSFDYCDIDIYVEPGVGQDAVVLQNGATFKGGSLRIRGNGVTSSSVQTAAFLKLTGAIPAGHPQAGGFSFIIDCHLDIQVECDSTNANGPYSIFFNTLNGSVGNCISNCYGILRFNGNYRPTNISPIASFAAVLTFIGPVTESVLNPTLAAVVNHGPSAIINGPVFFFQSAFNGANGATWTSFGDFMSGTLSANVTINLQAIAGPQRKTVVIKQSAGGSNTVTWPHNASPTTSAPKVVWAGGTAPTMTAAANATDVYHLETIDGATWYGRVEQNVS